MNLKYSKSLGLIAVLYFASGMNAQTTDSIKEKTIEEVVVIGYGSVKKKNVTSAIENIKSDVFEDRPIYNIGQALQGNAAGVSVIQNSGKPGQSLNVKIRGNNSISSGVNPLYVVDGIQTNDVSGINTDDIVDITILKDATSTAIYGINGSSGVVIITTKRAKANRSELNFNAYWGVSEQVDNVDVLNPEEYRKLMGEINPAYLTTIDNPRYAGIQSDWRKEVFRTGFDQNYNVNYTFGNEKMRAYTSLGYQGIDGIVAPSKFERVSAKINLDSKINHWLKVNASLNYINTKLKNTNDNAAGARAGVILSTLTTPTFMPAYADQLKVRETDTNGNYLDGYKDGQFAMNPFTAGWENPVAFQYRGLDNTNTQRFLSNIGLEVHILPTLVWKPSVSLDVIDSVNDKFIDAYRSVYGRSEKGTGSQSFNLYQDFNFENTLNYTLKSGVHDLGLLGGFQLHERNTQGQYFWGNKFPEYLREFVFDLSENPNQVFRKEILRELSYFGRAIYTLDNKYTVMGVFRYNGSSALDPDKKWGFFPGVSASWNISNENFLVDNTIISDLKLRGGWGKTGNASGIPPYSHFNLERLNQEGPNGSWSTYQWASDIGWEVTTDTNFGVDFGFVNNRIKLTADFYKRTTDDLIMPIAMGQIGNILRNVGSMENKGMEFTLNTVNIKNENFTWNTNFNISFNKSNINEIAWMPNIDRAGIEGMGNLVRFTAGQPIGAFFGYQMEGVNPQTGDIVYRDLDGDGTFNTADRTFIGNPNPDYTFGFSNNLTYKNWYFDVLVTASQGNDIYNASRFELELMNDFKNQSTVVLDRWTTPGQITNVPRAKSNSAMVISDRFIEDGSFIKLKSATLGYNFAKPMKGVNKLNLYVTGQNLYTWTDYTGFDPEVNAFANTNGVTGIDYGTYPQVRTVIFGLKANF
ncbi:SusC/RagA family TonB-linked outer membrane protein [Kaistella yonginensis]|uniref:SusC/RagA family TonB-linked outer membrane protein n=1 Tax=Kaistella yonginensis TaxID=658267 RepID=UPI0025B5F578|nr:SusC/RagA family TonB-linked outer membrane protein [Kaistella yonginensis]MDN3606942.1 SusC/RagA family TonB-linked outer membrane protein [Kaistella yonginensis]